MDFDTAKVRAKNIRLRIYQPDAAPHCIGNSGPLVEWRLRKPGILRSILKHPGIKLGTSYVRGDWDVDTLQLPRLIETLLPEEAAGGYFTFRRLQLPRPQLSGPLDTHPHWKDSDAELARACLGEERLCSCAWFGEPGMTLEEAQRIQRRRLLGQLQLRPGEQLLDADAGWGSLALWLAEQADIRVVALVATHDQLDFATRLARRCGLHGQVQFQLGDIDSCHGQFDRVLLTTGPGRSTRSTLARRVRRLEQLLRDDGFAWLQVVSCCRSSGLSNYWLQRQLAPQNLPSLANLAAELETARLRTLHIEDRSAHWQSCLEHWAQRYHRHRDVIGRQFGEWLTRHWEFMLASQAAAIRCGQLASHDILIGNVRCGWPPRLTAEDLSSHNLTADLHQTITGLARHR